ncbi:MAG: hypothetical protein RM022_030575 [Nostoc sp. EfeVER01]|uniref:hypothetical protein n=1 Tax=unclassified Nostoc TaxID=2593658 RepID=UPI002AD394E2|nr:MULTISPECIES: hypothetical protein [unclassified Nostoc]MDZ7945193.1 hypothetical protein [Nostoc sp. EfeVER01]MDZ7993222.1 hypothetical protein [Nostoc sp. EspVER01]
MHLETEQILATLELLCSDLFVWETATQGEFNLWNLMISEGFVHLTDIELAFKHWQKIEEWGTPTNQEASDYEYAPPRSKRKDNTWNESIANERQGYYQQLQQLVENHLQNIQVYNLSFAKAAHQSFDWEHPDFSVSIVVGETSDRHWFCLAPTIPDQVSYDDRSRHQPTMQIVSEESPSEATQTLITEVKILLNNLTPITNYGYYYGGYKCTYQHQIVGALAKTKTTAIELALQAATMVFFEKRTIEFADGRNNSRKLSQFMNQCLANCTYYSISFWDVGYTYEIGQTPAGDWLGVRSTSEFDYNP